MKFKIARGPIGFLWCGIVSGDRRKRKKRQCDRQRDPKKPHLGTCALIGLIKRYTGCARLESRAADVCFWHKADITITLTNLLGVKRTCSDVCF
jgi:hypothetical protein